MAEAEDEKRDKLSDAIARLDWDACRVALSELTLDSKELLRRIRFSGCMALQRGNAAQRQRRDSFAASVEELLTELGATEDLNSFRSHCQQSALVERGYQAILETLQDATGDIAADQHVWGVVERLHLELLTLKRRIRSELRRRKTVEPVSLHIMGDDGTSFHPDAGVSTLVNVASASVKMFAYGNRWFDEKRNVLLPQRPFVSAKTRWRIGNTYVLGAAWRTLDFGAERWRYFGGEVRLGKEANQTTERPPRDVIEFCSENLLFELLEDIAGQRLDRLLVQMSADTSGMSFKQGDPSKGAPLPPGSCISEEEVLSLLGLSHILHFPVAEDVEEYAGLRLVEWIRGYLYLKAFLDQQRAVRGVVRFSASEFVSSAAGYDLPEAKATAFLECMKFGRETIDLFDAPLLGGEDGYLYAVREVVRIANVPRVVLSQLSGLGVQIGRKGRALERAVQERFRKNGISCAGFKFKIDGVQYDCDAALVWDRVLFVLECKNRSYSGHKPSRLYHFVGELADGLEQAERLSKFFADHPEIVRKHLGADAQWDRIVSCVVNGIPFSAGEIDGIYIYDASALARFFESRALNMVVTSSSGKTSLPLSGAEATLWEGEQPTAADLIHQMGDPVQVSMLKSHFTRAMRWGLASNTLLIAVPAIRSVDAPLDPKLLSVIDDLRGGRGGSK